MEIQKILNNNAVLASMPNGQKVVVIGKGIAFKKRTGDEVQVNDTHVKIYKPEKEGLVQKLSQLLDEIPIEHIKVSNEIIDTARKMLGNIDERIFLTLIDHISFAIERQEQGIEFHDTLWEIQSLYPREFEVAGFAIDIIQHRLGVRLPRAEASFFAFHFVNANTDVLSKARDMMQLITGILDIIKAEFDCMISENDPKYARFMTHLKYFSGIVLHSKQNGSEYPKSGMNSLLNLAFQNLKAERRVVDKIGDYVSATYDYQMSDDDRNYLILHLKQIKKEEK
ncbi:MAG: PRD domain-containing protein [Bifidobacteriaceae bacterium]|jgi:beta-glucoside operon transcriptional antiterminator|nr:PRD domain-containing protein [Bifidobacteriaceae bacterium]